MGKVISVNDFEDLEEKRGGSGLVVVDFWATWCKPCKDVAPMFDELSDKYDGIKFLKCDVGDLEEDELVDMGVEKIPAFFVYKNGKKIEEFVGNNCGEALEAYLKTA